jgi:phage terminase small subunit
MPLAAYCCACGRWIDAEELLQELRSGQMRGLLVGRPKYVTINPLVRISLQAATEMVRIAGEFGMSAAARARISAGIGGQPPDFGPFAGLIGPTRSPE